MSGTDVWFTDSAATIHVSPNREDFSSYRKYDQQCNIKAFGNNTVQGAGEGDIDADIECEGKITRIRLTQVMHVPGAEGKILSLKVLAQKGFESHILENRICITKGDKTYAEAVLGGELYKVKMKVIPPQESILAAVKRDNSVADLHTWHRRLGHLGESMLKKLVGANTVRGMEVMNMDTHLMDICKSCVMGKMDEMPFQN